MAYDKDIVLSVGLEPENVTETAKQLNDDIDQIFQKVSGHGNKLSTSFKSLQMQMDKARQRSVELQQSIAKMQNMRLPTETLSSYDKQIEDAWAQRGKIVDRMRELEAAGKTDYTEYKRLGKELDSINDKYDNLIKSRQNYILKGNAFIDVKETDQFKKMVVDLNRVNNQMVVFKQRAQDINRTNVGGATGSFQGLANAIGSIGRVLGRGTINAANTIFNRLGKALGTVATKAKNAAANLAKMAGRTIVNGIKKLTSAVTSLHKAGNKSNNVFNGGFKAFLKYGLGVRSLFALMRKLRSALADGFKELAKVHEPFNRAMSELMTSLKYLRDSFVSAFAPIIQTIAPVLSRFINLVADAVNKVGMLISSLTGKEYVKAIPVYQDYAESTETAAEKAKEAAKAEKERKKELEKLKRTIAGFDDVEILKGPDKDEEEEEETTTPSFVTSPILDSMKDFAQKLLDMWKNADFTELGRMIGEKLLDALNKIPWDKIKDVLARIAKSIATFLNGFLETPGLFSKIGETIAEAINSAFTFVESFVRNFHWDSLGRAIKDLILGVLNNLDWALIYKTFQELGRGIGTAIQNAFNNPEIWKAIFTTLSRQIRALVIFLQNLLDAVDWLSLGRNIGEGLKAGIRAIPWPDIFRLFSTFGTDLANFLNGLITPQLFYEVGRSVGNALNAALLFLNNFGTTFNWTQFGTSLAMGINGFLKTFNINQLAEGVRVFSNGFKDAIVAFIRTVRWYELGTKLAEIIRTLPWTTILKNFGTVFWEAINAVIELAKGVFKGSVIETPVTDALNDLQTTIQSISESIDFETLSEGFKSLVDALTPAVSGFAVGLIEAFNGLLKVGISFINALGPAFQKIADALNSLPEGTLEEFGEGLGKIAAALITMKGVTSVMTALGGFAAKLAPIGGAGTKAAAGAAAAAGKMTALDGAASGAAGATGGLLGTLSNIGGSLAFMDLFKQVIAILDGSKDKAMEADIGFLAVKQALEDTGLEGDKFGQKLAEVQEPMGIIGDSTAPDFAEAFGQVAQNFEAAGGDVKTFKDNLSEMLKSGMIGESQAKVIQDYINGIGSSAEQSETKTNDFTSVFDKFEDVDWKTAVKVGVLAAAIKTIGDNGKLSKDDAEKLYAALDAYEATGAKTELDKVGTAFKEAGTSSEEFVAAVASATKDLPPKLQAELAKSLKTLEDFGPDAKKKATESFEEIDNGAISGMESKEKDIKNKAEDLVKKDVLDTIDDTAGINSPAKETQKRGEYLDDGLIEGLKNKERDIKTKATDIIKTDILATMDNDAGMRSSASSETQKRGQYLGDGLIQGLKDRERQLKDKSSELIKTDVLNTVDTAAGMRSSASSEMQKRGQYLVDGLLQGMKDLEKSVVNLVNSAMRSALSTVQGYAGQFRDAGARITEAIASGMSNNAGSVNYAVQNIVNQIRNAFTYIDWSGLGHNIGAGIFNGLAAEGGSLNILAHNLAVGMYNSMVSALQIHSPSKKFAWIGKMTMLGLGEGIEDNEKFVSDTVQDVTDAIEDKASRTKAAINLDTNMGEVLTSFSDTVVNEFDKLISTLQALANFTVGALPSVVQGKVVPYSSGYTNDKYDNTNEELLNELDYINAHQLSIDDLESFLEPLFRRYLNISLYIGDEQIARHANAGNLKLERRYNN